MKNIAIKCAKEITKAIFYSGLITTLFMVFSISLESGLDLTEFTERIIRDRDKAIEGFMGIFVLTLIIYSLGRAVFTRKEKIDTKIKGLLDEV